MLIGRDLLALIGTLDELDPVPVDVESPPDDPLVLPSVEAHPSYG